MLHEFKTFFFEPVPAHANPVIHPDGSVHYFVEGRKFFAGFVGADGVILVRPYSIAIVSGSLHQVLWRSRATQPQCIN